MRAPMPFALFCLFLTACIGGGGSGASDVAADGTAGEDTAVAEACDVMAEPTTCPDELVCHQGLCQPSCKDVSCPPGVISYPNAGPCDEGESVELETQSGTEVGRCFGEGFCSLVCAPASPCCGGEAWTETSYSCMTPCAAVCSCDGKCGTVIGAECEAECGSCSGEQICNEDNICVDP